MRRRIFRSRIGISTSRWWGCAAGRGGVVVGRWWCGLIRGGFVDLKLFSRLLQPDMANAQWCGKVGMGRADCVAAFGERGAARGERFIGDPDCGGIARPEGWACER